MFGLGQHIRLRAMIVATAISLALIATAAQAQDSAAIVPGTDYAIVRKTLQAQGYQPLTFPRGGEFSPCVGSEAICEAYPEIVSCSGAGFNPCRFAFRAPDGSYLVGVASGETPEQMRLDGVAAANVEDSRAIENLLAGRPEFAEGADAEIFNEPLNAADEALEPSPASETDVTTPNSDEALGTVLIFALIVLGLSIYLMPTIIAFSRRHRYRWPILAFNIGAGWSGIGRISTLVWSVWPQNSAIADPLVSDATGVQSRQ